MRFSEIVKQAVTLLRESHRVTYRALKREFTLDDDALEDLKSELIDAQRVARDEEGKVLVWVGKEQRAESAEHGTQHKEEERGSDTAASWAPRSLLPAARADGERRQLTVMFCDLVGSTALSAQLDPEEYRAVVQHYHHTCAAILQRHEGYMAQPLGDGLLVYFGHPFAHEDDARRAVRAGLDIVEAMKKPGTGNMAQSPSPVLQVRIGIHTGLVVIGTLGASGRTEQLALGETPNLAARLQSLAEPNTVLISAATQRLLNDQFECQPFGSHLLKGIPTPIAVYHVQSERQYISPLAGKRTLTPLVGRDQEVGLLLDRWQQVQEGRGQVVLLNGEPGIGKSRLALTMKEHVTAAGSLLYEAHCSPYHQQSALYPLIDLWQRTLLFTRDDSPQAKVAKLEQAVALYGLQETVPLLTALLSLPTPAQYPPLTLTPQKQKERTLDALLQLLLVQAERQATVFVWEDMHWADPSSLEFLSLLIEQIPTTQLMLMLTFRPEFVPPWKPRSHISHLVLNRLGQQQVDAMIAQATAGTVLSPEVRDQIRRKTDGVPLFVEELTKSVAEAVVTTQVLPRGVTIPATLQDALMARLDRLGGARQIAQLGATIGREFSHDLIQAVATVSEADLHRALEKLVDAEIVYQRGSGEQARYFFKHALIQDTAYHSLLKSTRQQYHQQIARVLTEQFPETKATQPELLAHHYAEAGLIAQAIPYWQRAGQRAVERSADVEAISHLNTGVELLTTLPDTPERAQQELTLHLLLGPPLIATQGFTAPTVVHHYSRARLLCEQLHDSARMITVLWGLCMAHLVQGELRTAQTFAEECVQLADQTPDVRLSLQAYYALWAVLLWRGEYARARTSFMTVITRAQTDQQHSFTTPYGEQDPEVACLGYMAVALWLLGYPAQALARSAEAVRVARERTHPYSLAWALDAAVWVHHFRREGHLIQARADEQTAIAREHGFFDLLAWGTLYRGGALIAQGEVVEGLAQLHAGLAEQAADHGEIGRTYFLVELAEGYAKMSQADEGLAVVAEAFHWVEKNDERIYEAELYRLKGELTLQQESHEQGATSKEQKAEACFRKAIAIAQRQQAKSWELRATMSLARLWQLHDRRREAHHMLSEIYGWFTEGFDTRDLQDAKALLTELAEGQ